MHQATQFSPEDIDDLYSENYTSQPESEDSTNNEPLCNRLWDVGPNDSKTEKRMTKAGNVVDITKFKDGSSIVHTGGQKGAKHYDSSGKEC